MFFLSTKTKTKNEQTSPQGSHSTKKGFAFFFFLPLSSLCPLRVTAFPALRAGAFETSAFAPLPSRQKWQTRWDTSRAAPRRRRRRCRAASSASWRQSLSALLARSASRLRPCLPPLRTFWFVFWIAAAIGAWMDRNGGAERQERGGGGEANWFSRFRNFAPCYDQKAKSAFFARSRHPSPPS